MPGCRDCPICSVAPAEAGRIGTWPVTIAGARLEAVRAAEARPSWRAPRVLEHLHDPLGRGIR